MPHIGRTISSSLPCTLQRYSSPFLGDHCPATDFDPVDLFLRSRHMDVRPWYICFTPKARIEQRPRSFDSFIQSFANTFCLASFSFPDDREIILQSAIQLHSLAQIVAAIILSLSSLLVSLHSPSAWCILSSAPGWNDRLTTSCRTLAPSVIYFHQSFIATQGDLGLESYEADDNAVGLHQRLTRRASS